mmetsp:Transcript_23154/g.49317  ORF Transcript_23154/g.49317 Transcript_23154/m.49317 type:complete len:258 (+) Transcript_23154:365-1138(+)|eukprot:CAMPEP_0201135638 /NCGR_PEP_ID=MMETSP0850-20130426/54429_1 /ASSEMBLY_ACC=CAM_ASM_000622 /TAXON_ID=183588 /ORGANISM="Pseudo-nitzschia fraudulenta, Strain WWA7" /LENGTH=257 /DNA_ID=CAMNT_0047406831 /DNA_START=265 /DNA_END=1038 /DNA_ORIENTATION=-
MVLVDFFGSVALPDGSHERFMNQLVCHIFLLTLSLINVIYLFFVEFLGKGALQKSFLQQLAFFGALMQIGSCSNSITRYNIEDEYNYIISNAGAFFGLAAGCFCNIALAPIVFHDCTNRKLKWKIFSIALISASIYCLYMECTTFDETGFFYFRVMNMQSVPWTAFTIWYTSRALKKGTVTIDPSIISTEAAINMCFVIGVTMAILFLLNLSGVTIFIYISGGLAFGCVNVATYYMDKMEGLYDKPAGGETALLLPS